MTATQRADVVDISLLICPACDAGKLNETPTAFTCRNCGVSYARKSGKICQTISAIVRKR